MVENVWGSLMTAKNRGKKFDESKRTKKECPSCYNDDNFLYVMNLDVNRIAELECKHCGYIEYDRC